MDRAVCRIVELPKIVDQRGNLTFIEAGRHIPFDPKRVYYLYDVPGGALAADMHRDLEQFIVAASGSFTVITDDGTTRKDFYLNRSYYGLYVPTMIWREIDNFSSGSVCLVLASRLYEASDYIRDYDEFKRLARGTENHG